MSFPEKIEVICIPRTGDIDLIELNELPFPLQKPDEVLIKVQYAGVNFADTYIRSGAYPTHGGFPLVLGGEASGVIVKLPLDPQVSENEVYKIRAFKQGSPVVAFCHGTMAEYVSVPWSNVFVLPPNVNTKIGVAAFLQGLTVVTLLAEAYDVQKGDTILVHTVAGGLGLLFAQLMHARGATVIGTTSTEEKAKLAKKHGADHVILYTMEDTVKRVLEITNGEGVHAVFDGVGKDTFESNFEMLRRKGTFVGVGNASGPIPPFPPNKLTAKNLKFVRPSLLNYIVTPTEFYTYTKELFDLVANGTLTVEVYKEYPFTAEGVRQTHRDLTNRSTFGKLLVKVAE